MTRPDNRKVFSYHGVTVQPMSGKPRYFDCKHGEYLTRWWRVLCGPMSWVLVATKAAARYHIDHPRPGHGCCLSHHGRPRP